jgi:hypothetical protein
VSKSRRPAMSISSIQCVTWIPLETRGIGGWYGRCSASSLN